MNDMDTVEDEETRICSRRTKKSRRPRLLSTSSSSADETSAGNANCVENDVAESSPVETSPSGDLESFADLNIQERKRKRIRIVSDSFSSSEDIANNFDVSAEDAVGEKLSGEMLGKQLMDWHSSLLENVLMKAVILAACKGPKRTKSSMKPRIIEALRMLKSVTSTWNSYFSSEQFKANFQDVLHQLVPPVSLTLLAKLQIEDAVGVTWLRKQTIILHNDPTALSIFTDSFPLVFKRWFVLDEIEEPTDLVACKANKCLYIGDRHGLCIWKLKLKGSEPPEMKVWMNSVENLWTFSVTDSGFVVVPRNKPFDHIGVYDSKAQLMHKITLPEFVSYPGHAILKSNRNIILSHGATCCLSELDLEGKLLLRFEPESNETVSAMFLFKDFVVDRTGRTIFIDGYKNRVVLIDKILKRVTALRINEMGVAELLRLFYDSLKHRIVVVGNQNIAFFNIIETPR